MKKINLIVIAILFTAILFSCATTTITKEKQKDKNEVKMEEVITATVIKEDINSEPAEKVEIATNKDDSELDLENSTKEVETNENVISETANKETDANIDTEDETKKKENKEDKSENTTNETIIEPTITEETDSTVDKVEENIEEVNEEIVIESTDSAVKTETQAESSDNEKTKHKEVKIHKATAQKTINTPTSLASIWATLILAAISVIVAYSLRNKEGQALKINKILIILSIILVVTIIVSIFTSAIVLISVISLAPSYYILSRKGD